MPNKPLGGSMQRAPQPLASPNDNVSFVGGKVELSGKQGILPSQSIEDLARRGVIKGFNGELEENQYQPASIDLRLGARGYRVRASFLPGRGNTVSDQLKEFTLHSFSLKDGVVLERGCFYVLELQEILSLPKILFAVANPKSSTGRLDVFTRLIADGGEVFDLVESEYRGRLYVEVCPMTFSVRVQTGTRLNQLRFVRRTSGQDRFDRPALDDNALRRLHKSQPLITEGAPTIRNGLNLRVDLHGSRVGAIIGYKALKYAGIVDCDRKSSHKMKDFWEPIRSNKDGILILDPDEFYILASKECMQVPPEFAAEMAPIDPMMGEFRAHYAGFFDPGFGHMADGKHGSRAVLEVRSHDVPFALRDGQIIARLIYENLTERPDALYGEGLGSNYQGQGLKLSKHFR